MAEPDRLAAIRAKLADGRIPRLVDLNWLVQQAERARRVQHAVAIFAFESGKNGDEVTPHLAALFDALDSNSSQEVDV